MKEDTEYYTDHISVLALRTAEEGFTYGLIAISIDRTFVVVNPDLKDWVPAYLYEESDARFYSNHYGWDRIEREAREKIEKNNPRNHNV